MTLIVTGSKYDKLLKENKKITNYYNSSVREVEQLKEENKKIASLKDRYSLHVETLQNENNDLKIALSLVREDVVRMQTEILHLKRQINQNVKDEEKVIDDAVLVETTSSPEITLETIKNFLINFDIPTKNGFFNEIIDQKTNEANFEQTCRYNIAKMINILNSILEYAHKEDKLLNLLKLSDPSAPIDDLKTMIENTKLYHIKRCDIFY